MGEANFYYFTCLKFDSANAAEIISYLYFYRDKNNNQLLDKYFFRIPLRFRHVGGRRDSVRRDVRRRRRFLLEFEPRVGWDIQLDAARSPSQQQASASGFLQRFPSRFVRRR